MLEILRRAAREARGRSDLSDLIDDCRMLLDERGEANGFLIAKRALEAWERLDADARLAFFAALAVEFDPDADELLRLARAYAESRSPTDLVALSRVAEAPRQELMRRLNRAPGGTAMIVRLREEVLRSLRQAPHLVAVDADLQHLLTSWFNPGFLQLVRVDWNSPAQLLEKIILHEAVHQIDGWSDLRRRLRSDRRCFAFFHPVLPGEPLIFVEVALLPEMPDAIAPLLDRRAQGEADLDRVRVAAFYSISNCQPGLRGVNLGNFLIKQVALQLKQEFPRLRTFCTLSPIPGFHGWLKRVERIESERLKPQQIANLEAALALLRAEFGADLAALQARETAASNGRLKWPLPAGGASLVYADDRVPVPHPGRRSTDRVDEAVAPASTDATVREEPGLLERWTTGLGTRRDQPAPEYQALKRLCAFYLWQTSPTNQRLSDPVARFHLSNGARLERINLHADSSLKGIEQSFGLMVNYQYDLDAIEANHQSFQNDEVTTSRQVLGLL